MKSSIYKKSLPTNLILSFLLVFVLFLPAQAQQATKLGVVSQLSINAEGDIQCIMHHDDGIAHSHHNLGLNLNSSAHSTTQSNQAGQQQQQNGNAEIIVSYFNFDPTFPVSQLISAINSFQSAVDIWAQTLTSDEPIFVAAVFQPLGPGVLGSAGPTFINSNFPGSERDTWYGNALADKLAGEDQNPEEFDIIARFSTVFPNWYYGTDGNPPASDFDFRTVVLHELGHGLGFFGSMFADNTTGIGSYGFGIPSPVYPAIYDRLAHDRNGKQLLKENKYANFSTDLGSVLLDDPLVFRGPRIAKATNGKGARIFTVLDLGPGNEIPGFTNIWLSGSSYSHLDFFTYAGTQNGLMVPFLSRGLAFDDPGSITKAIFDDMGWNGKVNKPFREGGTLDENGALTDGQLKIFPNPVSDVFTVELGRDDVEVMGSKIYDLIGRSYQSYYRPQADPGLVYIRPLENLNPGMYILELELSDQSKETIRFFRK